MTNLDRRTLISSIASSVLFAAGPAHALVCDVRRSRENGVSTKAYTCQIDNERSLTATFVRMSDMVADRIGSQQLPGGYDALLTSSHLIETPTLDTFENLLRRFSFPIESNNYSVTFDGRKNGVPASESDFWQWNGNSRFRTLGVWDDPDENSAFFPLPNELRRAIRSANNSYNSEFLRYATYQDFQNLPQNLRDYTKVWREEAGPLGKEAGYSDLGNLDLMTHIEAWAVPRFLPLYFSTFNQDDCTGEVYGGAYYIQPALYVDAMVCRNTGSEYLFIDDFFGAEDSNGELRNYSSATPPGESSFGWRPIELAPGESAVVVQRLLFAAEDEYDEQNDSIRSFSKAIYGPTQLPKGIVMNGQRHSFNGRSHNTLIVNSYYAKGSCPYLSYWCDLAQEWVELGKVITGYNAPELEGEENREFSGLCTQFKLVEREHERTTLRSAKLEIETRVGTVVHLNAPDSVIPESTVFPLILDLGQMVEFAFALPKDLSPSDVVKTRLRLQGYYQNYRQEDLEQRKEVILA